MLDSLPASPLVQEQVVECGHVFHVDLSTAITDVDGLIWVWCGVGGGPVTTPCWLLAAQKVVVEDDPPTDESDVWDTIWNFISPHTPPAAASCVKTRSFEHLQAVNAHSEQGTNDALFASA